MGTPKLFYLTHQSKASLSDYSEDSILNSKKAKKLQEIEIQRKINIASQNAISSIAQEMMLPIALLREDEFYYVNNKMAMLLNRLNETKELSRVSHLNSLLLKRDNYASSISDLEYETEGKKNSIKNGRRTKLFYSQEIKTKTLCSDGSNRKALGYPS